MPGDPHFEELLARHAKVVGAAIRRVCKGRHAELAEDAEQELRIALWKRMRGGKEIEHPVSYLYKAALTTALAVLRRQRPQEVDVPVEVEETAAAPAASGARGLLPAEEARLLAQLLERLPDEQSRALRAYLAGFNHGEVAQLYGWTDSVARHRIYRGMDALRAAMDEEGTR